MPAGNRLLVPARLPRRSDVRRLRRGASLRSQPRRPRARGGEDWSELAGAVAWLIAGSAGHDAPREPGSGARAHRSLPAADAQPARARGVGGEAQSAPRKIAVIVDFAEFAVPRGDAVQLGGPFSANVVKALGWANDPAILQSNIITVFISEGLHDLNELRRAESAHRVDSPAVARRSRDAHVHRRRSKPPSFPTCAAAARFRWRCSASRLTGLSRVGARTTIALALGNGQTHHAEVADRSEEGSDRARVPGAARVHRVAVHARIRSQATTPSRRWLREDGQLLRRGAAARPAHGIPDRRPHRHRQDVSRAVLGRRARRTVRRLQELPRPLGRRDGIEPREDFRRASRDRTGGRVR